MKAVLTTTLGLYIGAFISQKMAAFLEENELFVPEDGEEVDWGGDDGDWSQYLQIFLFFQNVYKFVLSILQTMLKLIFIIK